MQADRDRLVELESAFWAQSVAQEIVDEFSDAAAIDTASYRICGFVDAAARLALADPEVARRIGEQMAPPREMDHELAEQIAERARASVGTKP